MLLCSPGGGTKVKGRGAFTLTSIPFDGLTALSRFDKLTTLSWPKGQPKGSPLKGEEDEGCISLKEGMLAPRS